VPPNQRLKLELQPMKWTDRSVAIELANVSALSAEMPTQADSWLSDSERQRLSSINSSRRHRQFLSGHWLLRRLATKVFGDQSSQWSVTTGLDRAPVLQSLRHGVGDGVRASLSHSGDWVVAAIANFPVGVDLECPSKPRDLLALADMTFSPEERATLRTLPENERPATFYLYWTLKEATGKREGHGLRPELARRQRPAACVANEAGVVSWRFADCSLALAGQAGMSVRAEGLPETALPSYWRIEPATI
jgi:4'-phosphopantetheinyl transferase